MNKITQSLLLATIVLSASFTVNAKSPPPPEEELRIKPLDAQLTGELIGLNVVEYGAGELYLPVIKSEKEICTSIISTMHALTEKPEKASDYDYQVAVHCDEFINEKVEINGYPVKNAEGEQVTRAKSKGFGRSYLIELENGVRMHSVKFTSGTLKVWPKEMYLSWMDKNSEDVLERLENKKKAMERREAKRQERQKSKK
jgi:hypothetical protein